MSGLKSDVYSWLQSLRFSGLTAVILGLVIVAGIVLTPNITVFLQQKRELNERRLSVELHRQALDEAEAAKLKWQDPVYIRAQARDRLYYVMPGETQLSVLTDGLTIPTDEVRVISGEIAQMEHNWPLDLARSVVISGTTSANPQDFFGY